MEEKRGGKLFGGSLKGVRRRAVELSAASLVDTSFLTAGDTLPLVVHPAADAVQLAEWLSASRDFVEAQLQRYGALLFRGFAVQSAAGFERCAQAISGELFPEYGDLPRASAGGAIYHSTPYPPDERILFHNEASHTHRWPLKQWFFCAQPAQQGGETPVVDCRRVYALLSPRLVERFRQKKVMYVRNFTTGLDVSWQQFFGTDDPSAVERLCRATATDCEWRGDSLRIRQVRPAVATHPHTGEAVFFNQLQLHHVSCMPPALRAAALALFGSENMPRSVYYGDGSPIEDAVMAEIDQVYSQTAISFRWQADDILLLDNMLIAHARNPYKGPRTVLVAMAEMVSGDERAA